MKSCTHVTVIVKTWLIFPRILIHMCAFRYVQFFSQLESYIVNQNLPQNFVLEKDKSWHWQMLYSCHFKIELFSSKFNKLIPNKVDLNFTDLINSSLKRTDFTIMLFSIIVTKLIAAWILLFTFFFVPRPSVRKNKIWKKKYQRNKKYFYLVSANNIYVLKSKFFYFRIIM